MVKTSHVGSIPTPPLNTARKCGILICVLVKINKIKRLLTNWYKQLEKDELLDDTAGGK